MNDLAPQITPLATEVINDPTMPAGLFQSYARLFAAARASNFQRTEPLEFDSQLVPLLGLRRSQARQHLQALRFAKLLDWSTDGGNRYVIYFTEPSAPQLNSPSPPGDEPPEPVQSHLPGKSQANVRSRTRRLSRTRDNPKTPGNPHQRAKPRLRAVSRARDKLPLKARDKARAAKKTGFPDSLVVGGVDPPEKLSESIQQHQQPPVKMPLLSGEWAAIQQAVHGWLLRAGVWVDVAGRLAQQVAENERRMQQQDGPRYLAGQADVLGWMAYCFAEREKNGISLPAAVLAANLGARRRCPDEYRPEAVCSRCHCSVAYCACPDEPQAGFPPEFLEYALRSRKRYLLTPQSRWGVCESCHAFPCQC
jgi:hypothetical protein